MTSNNQRTGHPPSNIRAPLDRRLIIRLENAFLAERDLVGTKSAILGELMRAGFDVPDGFVLSSGAFLSFVAEQNTNRDPSAAVLTPSEFPTDVAAALECALPELGDGPLAVRSSAVDEDLETASFAGMYETVLGVLGLGLVIQAVRLCWDSAFGERVAVYRAVHGLNSSSRMAVLVQKLVPAEASGIAFTADPLTGDTSVTLINATSGLGEAIAAGRETPNEWRVEGDLVRSEGSFDAVLDTATVLKVADIARRVEAHYRCPQDIEWAISGGHIYLLQARPITALRPM